MEDRPQHTEGGSGEGGTKGTELWIALDVGKVFNHKGGWLVHLLGFGLSWQNSRYCLYILQKLTKSIKTIVSQKICMVYPNNKNWDFSKLGNTNLRDLERNPLIKPPANPISFKYSQQGDAAAPSLVALEVFSPGAMGPASSWCLGLDERTLLGLRGNFDNGSSGGCSNWEQ